MNIKYFLTIGFLQLEGTNYTGEIINMGGRMIIEWNAPVPPLSSLEEDNKKIKEIAISRNNYEKWLATMRKLYNGWLNLDSSEEVIW